MRVEYQAQGGRITERFRVDFTPAEYEALADLAHSLFADGKSDPLSRGMQRIALEHGLDMLPQPTLNSVPDGGHVTALAPISSEGRSE